MNFIVSLFICNNWILPTVMINRAQTSKPHPSRLSSSSLLQRPIYLRLSLFVSRQIRIPPFLSLCFRVCASIRV
ncbi:unnamed protein product, partial [Vitis vinifera]